MGDRSILFILPNFSAGGAERVTLNLLVGLYNLGYSVNLLVFDNKGPLSSMLPIDVKVYDLKTGSLTRSILSLIKEIRLIHPDLIFSTFGYINIVLLFLRPFLKRNVNIWIREANLPSISLPNNKKYLLMWIGYFLFYRSADRILCTSEKMRTEFFQNFYIPISKLYLLPNPINEKLIRAKAISVMRDSCDSVCYIAVGRLTYQKGFDRLLLWFSKIDDNKSKLRIFGKGELREKLIRKTKDLGINDRVFFSGYNDNPWSWIAGSDVYLLSSRWEGMPNVALEALACGTPVIATTESGGIYDVKVQSKPGSIIVASTESEFIKAMNNIHSKPAKNLSKSLLPRCYKLNNVIDLFTIWIEEIN